MELALVDPKFDLIILKSFHINKKIKQLLNKSSEVILYSDIFGGTPSIFRWVLSPHEKSDFH